MSVLTKEQTFSGSKSVALRQGWKIFESPSVEAEKSDFENSEVMDLRITLNQAETIIRAQKGRIRDLEETALTDELTGLANRRGFSISFKRELAMTRRDADYAGILVIIEFDEYKSINDTFGHQTGEAYLRAIADVLRNGVRANDTVGRLSGNEFALLLTHMDEIAGVMRLSKLEKALRKKAVLPEKLPLNATFGFAAYTGTSSADAVMQTAGLRLYANKSRDKKAISAD